MAKTLRMQHLTQLETLTGPLHTRYIGTGSRSMFKIGIGDALVLMCTGVLDREGRLACHIRTCDAEALLAHPGSAVSCLWPGLAAPLVIPAAVLEAPLRLLTPTGANQLALKLRVRNGIITVVPTETRVDQFAGGAYLRALHATAAPGLAVPRLTHAHWQTLVAALEHHRGCDVAVPANDRTRLDVAYLASMGLTRVDALPATVRKSRAIDVDVVATPRGGDVPIRLVEVEFKNDVRAALHRCAQVVAHLREQGVTRLPRIVVVADASRQATYNRYVNEAPLPTNGVTALCEFRSFAEVYSDALRLLPALPRLRAA